LRDALRAACTMSEGDAVILHVGSSVIERVRSVHLSPRDDALMWLSSRVAPDRPSPVPSRCSPPPAALTSMKRNRPRPRGGVFVCGRPSAVRTGARPRSAPPSGGAIE